MRFALPHEWQILRLNSSLNLALFTTNQARHLRSLVFLGILVATIQLIA